MQYLPFIIIGILTLLLSTVILVFVFNQKFRQDVIAGKGKASIFGILSVEGVIIVVLCGIIAGCLIYFTTKFLPPQILIKKLPGELQMITPEETLEKIREFVENKNLSDEDVLDKIKNLDYDSELSKKIRDLRTRKKGPWFQAAKTLTIGIPQKFNQPKRGYSYVCSGSDYANSNIRLTNALNDDFGKKIDLEVKGGGIDELDCVTSKRIPDFLLNCFDARELFSEVFIECTDEGESKYKQRYYEELKKIDIPDDSPRIYLPVWVIIKDS